MKKEQIHINDWARILFGEVPATFYLELIFRALIVYLLLMFSMRAMGKRMSSQLSRNELAALVSLAAAVGVPMMAPNRGLLPAVVIAIVVICVQRLIAARAAKSQTFEKISQGNISILVKDSLIDVKELERAGISKGELFEQLRGQAVLQLGEIDRFYMEANGAFTLVKAADVRYGLSVIPKNDQAFFSELEIESDQIVCNSCGLKKKDNSSASKERCEHCGHDEWLPAIRERQ